MSRGELIEAGAAAIQARLGTDFPKTAIILGSGLGAFAGKLETPVDLAFSDIPGFVPPAVAGHAGHLLVGTFGAKPLAVLAGRIHGYEGHAPQTVATPIRILKKLGVETLVLTNASGGLKPEMTAGTLVVVSDHINFAAFNPLVGPNDEAFGLRFPDMSAAYDAELRALFAAAAREADVTVTSGVYLFTLGPNFETPAEVRMFAALGADIVGMSTVPECLAARHCGMRVAALSVVTNLAAGIATRPLSHADTLAEAQNAYRRVELLLDGFLRRLPLTRRG